jgi:hypothetical protein
MFDWFWQAAETVQHAAVKRREAEMLPPDRVKDDRFPNLVDGQKFVSGGAYFGVRLAGLHIQDARRFGATQFPLFVSLAEFRQRGQDRSVPFSVGPREITEKLAKAGALREKDPSPGWIELRDLPIIPPTPVGTGNLSFFSGLYSVPGDDVVSTLLDVVGSLSKSAVAIGPLAAIDPALNMVRAVYSGFGSLMGLNKLQALVQAQSGRALPGTGSGYLVVANVEPGFLLNNPEIVVRGGKLCRGKVMVTDLDYCLIAIERYVTVLEEATGIAPDLFDAEWQAVLDALNGGEAGASKTAMRKLMAVVRGTPLLIDADRTAAMTAYLRRYTEEVTLAENLDKIVTRGGGNELAEALEAARNQEEKNSGSLAARKLTTVLGLVSEAQDVARSRRQDKTLSLAAESRTALLEVGEGADEILADALLRAV